jgi:ribonucleoside-triphosphate reductase
MNIENKILSDIVVYNKYAKYIPDIERRESWNEIVERNMQMHIDKFPQLKNEIEESYKLVLDKKILPSMRSLQFAGRPISLNNARIFNCSYLPIDDYRCFSEIMFLLLSGCGVGYSVQYKHIDKLPEIQIPTKTRRYLVGDSIEGWADAVRILTKSYFGKSTSRPEFDFRDIRPKGTQLITAGGKAPGAEPLKECLFQIQKILDRKQNGDKLKPIEAHDISCHIADAVLSGGIRRAALISLFNADDDEMLTCKFGNWWENNPQRGRANNSVVLVRHKVTKSFFMNLWKKVEASNSGEPGISWTNNPDMGFNPCHEISLRPYQFCNLCEVNVDDVVSQEDLNERVRVGAFLGTLQASYTNFHYLREIWKRNTEKDALIGIGMTGIASGESLKYDLKEAAQIGMKENERVAELIGINPAARVTTVKPAGTSSLVLGVASGIHAWHGPYYIRRMRIGKNEPIYTYLIINHPELIEDDFFKPNTQAIISVPQKAPDNAIIRTESALDLLERVKKFNIEWVQEGHRSGDNYNNVSATISIKENEWEEVGNWMWLNKKTFSGLSVLPYDNGSYIQAPYESCTKERYEELVSHLHNIDLTKIVEFDDNTELMDQVACVSGVCEIV